MHISKKSLSIIISVSLITIITVPSIIFILFELNKETTSNHPSNMGVEEWFEDFDALYNFIEDNYPYILLKERCALAHQAPTRRRSKENRARAIATSATATK